MINNEIKDLLLKHVTIPIDKRHMFFKTGIGEYAAHDKFLGVTVPNLRKISIIYKNLTLEQIENLLSSEYNEERLLALFILVNHYKKNDLIDKEDIYQFYLKNIKYVNNWNLVDASAHLIIGAHLENKERDILLKYCTSNDLWERRISIVATWWFIKQNDLAWTFKLAKLLLSDQHDLMHKATGWMLREAGKKNQPMLIDFLTENYKKMPRTMLRYSIEHLSLEEKKFFMQRN